VIRGMLIMSPPLEISAAEPPSQVPRPLPWQERSHLIPVTGTSNLRTAGEKEPQYRDVGLTRAELDRYVEVAKGLSDAL